MSQSQKTSGHQHPALVQWVDIAKGIGICLVVIGHVITNEEFAGLRKYIYWFHMPLFFLISGLLYRQQKSFSHYAKSRFRQLLIPYCCFLAIFFILFLLGFSRQQNTLQDFILGGDFIGSGVWWFITSLFFTQLAASLIIQTTSSKAQIMLIAGIMYYVSAMLTIKHTVFMWGAKFVVFKLPWALETVPIALFFYLCGYMFKNYLLSEKPLPRTALVMLICFFCTAVCLDSTGLMPIPFYSILNLLCSYPMTYPGLDILLPIAGFLLVRELAVRLSKLNAMGKLFTSLGLASMVIMYLHGSVNAIAVRLVFAELSISPALRVFQILLAVFLPLGIYSVFLKFETTRKLFLGLWTAAGVAVRRQSVRYNREQQ